MEQEPGGRPVFERVIRALDLAAKIVGAVIFGGIVLLVAWIFFMNMFVWGDDDDPKPHTAPSPTHTQTPVAWYPTGMSCADGWKSPSIGRRGACSYHGGVVTWYQSVPGDLITLCPPKWQPGTLEQARKLVNSFGQVGCAVPDPNSPAY